VPFKEDRSPDAFRDFLALILKAGITLLIGSVAIAAGLFVLGVILHLIATAT
jgi:hypothetical protein